MDETLVLTGDADRRAYQDVAAVAAAQSTQAGAPAALGTGRGYMSRLQTANCVNLSWTALQINAHQLLEDFHKRFIKAAWDPRHEVGMSGALHSCRICTKPVSASIHAELPPVGDKTFAGQPFLLNGRLYLNSLKHAEIHYLTQVPVDKWRIGLWHQALQEQGVTDMELAAALQAKFSAARLEHFCIEPGVKVQAPRRLLASQHIPKMPFQETALLRLQRTC